ncbi:pyrroline-5-carboxylate reductase [Endozoicomonas numazuensis]|uniref:Pyrroline-5-carboxylate reductase n=1 Tax=Endozoicomonas numazuensis TaxID=1137799 RepID=A0A081NIJ9_9GAMM|nr:pyrroline-5-carboxylate reductase [Endozoicomonas numazuensis]KEQ18272.1 pyrroline-5-carboxylate reductase [Endozoicomonas numazuensis]
MTDKTIAFIGAGNMATSIMGGLIEHGWPKDRIFASCRTEESARKRSDELGIHTSTSNLKAAAKAAIVVLAVKPQMMRSVLTELAPALQKQKPFIISVAAGIRLKSLDDWSGGGLPIVRSMPNTPSLLHCGATGLFANTRVNDALKATANEIFEPIGILQWLEREEQVDTITALSGSGPAYFFLFMEAMTEAGVKLGLDHETAERFSLQTALGAANMAVQSDVDAAELRRRVTSPGGTTEQALKTFRQEGFEEVVYKAVKAAKDRGAELAEQLAD